MTKVTSHFHAQRRDDSHIILPHAMFGFGNDATELHAGWQEHEVLAGE